MATDRPRKNIYLDKRTESMLKEYAYHNGLSESEVCRQAIDTYLLLATMDSWESVCNMAEAKELHPVEIIDAALIKVIPEKYYRRFVND